ncbi:serine hydrolase domain-containing protein [Streptomyces sp. A5-4]|uniref:serine hydrolase domain-containing protein n=1 Tax=Streptomyces sp. A5-4 TaxID=3384771 RepID=UPI003DA7DE97
MNPDISRWRRTPVAGPSTGPVPGPAPGGATTAVAVPGRARFRPAHDRAAIRTALNAYQAETGPGAGLYAGDSSGAWTVTAGTGTVDACRPVRSTDHVRIGGQTKTFTAAVVLQLVDERRVVLDSPVGRYLPGVIDGNGHKGDVITVRQLLQHTSGAAVQEHPPFPEAGRDGGYTLAALVRAGLSRPPVSAPGGAFQYSHTNYAILGMLIERVTGVSAAAAITGRIIEPLGLTRTAFPAAGDRSVPAPAVQGYIGARLGTSFFWTDVLTSVEPSLLGTAGAMISTQRDVTAFYRALLAGGVVSHAALAEMQRAIPVGPLTSYGLGLTGFTLSCGATAWGHGGCLAGHLTTTMVTADGRHASTVTNAAIDSPKLMHVIDAALCG